MHRYIIGLNLQGKDALAFYRLMDIPYGKVYAIPGMIAQMILKRKKLSSFTTMPRTFKVYGESCPDYEQWLCDRLNRKVTRTIYYPGKHTMFDLEAHASFIEREEGKPLKNIYEIYKENCTQALDYVKKNLGVGSIQQWFDKNLDNLQDRPFDDCKIIVLNEKSNNTVVTLTIDTNDDLRKWYKNVKNWFENEGIQCSLNIQTIDLQASVVTNNF